MVWALQTDQASVHFLSEKYCSAMCLEVEVDMDGCQDVASEWEVKCMSTFQFLEKVNFLELIRKASIK